jgi:hypothetical protein
LKVVVIISYNLPEKSVFLVISKTIILGGTMLLNLWNLIKRKKQALEDYLDLIHSLYIYFEMTIWQLQIEIAYEIT